MTRLTKRQIDKTISNPLREMRLWDDNPRGFGLRVKPSGVKTFFVQYTSPLTRRKVRYTLGRYGPLTLEEARTQARKVLGCVAGGEDPSHERKLTRQEAKLTARTVGELCESYLKDANLGRVTYRGRPKKATTLATDRGRIDRHIKPLLGHKLVRDVTRADVSAFFHAVREGRTAVDVRTGPRGRARVTGGVGAASRTVGLLGSLFSYAVRQDLVPTNPVHGFERPPDGRRDRALSPEEYRRLGAALETLAVEGANPVALSAIRTLALTGCRRGEILGLRKEAIDSHRQVLRFADTKTGQQLRSIGQAALHAILDAPGKDGSPYAFPASRGDGPTVGIRVFQLAIARAGLEGVSLHTLRHSFASTALELGYSELTIACLLGHHQHSMTSRYVHHTDRALVAAADRVSKRISDFLDRRPTEIESQVVPLRA